MTGGAGTEPVLSTDRAHAAVLEELIRREPIFHHPELGTTRSDFESQTRSRKVSGGHGV